MKSDGLVASKLKRSDVKRLAFFSGNPVLLERYKSFDKVKYRVGVKMGKSKAVNGFLHTFCVL